MKKIYIGLMCLCLTQALFADLNLRINGAGSDGAFNPTNDYVVDLSQAVTNTWDLNNSTNSGKGVYDSEKWAVVFKYSSVNIPVGVTVTFKNHPSRAPVVWLVDGDVTIAGTINLNGGNSAVSPSLAEPGPGGFRGGPGWYHDSVRSGAGLGPGGGDTDFIHYNTGFSGSFGTVPAGAAGPAPYGNSSLLPLIGGSGGGGDWDNVGGGGAGGGALAIFCVKTLDLAGWITADGGIYGGHAGGGSGGAIRLVCNTLTGTGTLRATGGAGYHNAGGVGRIRIESANYKNTFKIAPSPDLMTLVDGATPLIWPPDSAPTVKIISVGDKPAPANPLASFGTSPADIVLPQTNSVHVLLETVNAEEISTVTVRYAPVNPEVNTPVQYITAQKDQVVSVSPLVIRWKAEVPVVNGYGAMQVKVVRP